MRRLLGSVRSERLPLWLCGAVAGLTLGFGLARLASVPAHAYLFSAGRVEPVIDSAWALAVALGAPLDRGPLLAVLLCPLAALGGAGVGWALQRTALARRAAVVACPLLALAFTALAGSGFLALWIHRSVANPLALLPPTLAGLALWSGTSSLLLGSALAAIGLRGTRRLLVACLLVAVLALWFSRPVALDEAAASVAVTEPPHRLLFIGLDAASWANMEPLLEAGRLPRIAALRQRGAHGELRSLSRYFSPSLWTTMVTGVRPVEHGILDFTRGGVPYTSNSRTAWALWEILPLFGQRSAFHYWWASWPAEAVDGRIVTDRLLDRELEMRVFPPEDQASVDAIADAALDEAPGVGSLLGESEISREFRERHAKRLDALERSLARDQTIVRLGLDALDRDFDLVAVYLRGADIVGHTCWKWHYHGTSPGPARWLYGEPDRDQAILAPAVARMYEQIDRWVGQLEQTAGPDTNVLIVSDHGMTATGPNRKSLAADQSGDHHVSGMFLLAGPDARAGHALRGASVYDVFPTVLHLLGLPVPESSRGRVLAEALSDEARKRSLLQIAGFGPREDRDTTPLPSPVDERHVEQLKALGYITD